MHYTFRILLFAFIALCMGLSEAEIHVEITGTTPLAAPGDDVTFACKITDANVGDLVYFVKSVSAQSDFYEQIAANGIMTPLYESFERFTVEIVDTGDAHLLILNIYSVTYEDTGIYACIEAKTKVRDSVRMEVYKQADEVNFVGHDFMTPYVFTEGIPQEVECVIQNVVPLPNVRIYIDEKVYTDNFNKSNEVEVLCDSGDASKGCPMYYNYDVTMKHVAFMPDYYAHGQMLMCESNMQVPYSGMERKGTRAPIIVNYSPKYICDTEFQVPLYKPYNLTCNITSHPKPTAVAWHFMIGDKPYHLDTGDKIQGFAATEQVVNGTVRTYTLVIEQVTSDYFTTYSLHTQQEIANNTFNITLTEQHVTTETTGGATSSSIMTSYFIFSVLLSVLYLS